MADQVIVPNGTIVEETRYTTRTMQRWMNGVTDAVNAPAVPGVLTKLSETLIVAGGTTISFPAIAQTYRALQIWFKGADTVNLGEIFLRLMFNGDNVAANYSATQFQAGSGGTTSTATFAATAAGMNCCPCPGVLANANAFGHGIITIPMYADAVFRKSFIAECYESVQAVQVVYKLGANWLSTAPITSMLLTNGVGGSAFRNGTYAALFGIS